MLKDLPGFQGSQADVFLKLGGSILGDLSKCQELASSLSVLAASYKIIIFPGGGPIDKYIESLDQSLHFPPLVHHQACARAQDQTGLIFGSLCNNAGYFCTPTELADIFSAKKLAIMLPMKLIIDLDVFAKGWEITSDTMSAFFAYLFSIERFAILTNVDGVYQSRDDISGRPIPSLRASELKDWGRTSVDECLSPFLLKHNMRCHVLNGFKPSVVTNWIRTGECNGTTILPE